MTLHRPEPTVVADANVLHSNDQRNVLMTLATERLLDLRWTKQIEDEWIGSLERRMSARDVTARREIEAPPGRFSDTARKMRVALPGHEIRGHEAFFDKVPRTAAADRHVAAAAAACSPSVLVTWNLSDFDAAELGGLGVTLSDPDTFLCRLHAAEPELVSGAVQKAHGFVVRGHVRRGRHPPSFLEYIEVLATRGSPNALTAFAERMKTWTRRVAAAGDRLGAAEDDLAEQTPTSHEPK